MDNLDYVGNLQFMRPALIVLFLILLTLLISCILLTKSKRVGKFVVGMVYATTVLVLICTFLCMQRYRSVNETLQTATPTVTTTVTEATTASTTEPSTQPTTVPPTEPDPTYEPGHTENSDPNNWKIKWDIFQNGSITDSYKREETITFQDADTYSSVEGVITFRGNNYRTGATYGNANIVGEAIAKKWGANISSFNKWTGCGWTGQPLIVRWDDETKAIMNLYTNKKNKDNLVEVIYATLDGNIYFYDLDDGSYTRDPIWVGMNFKGAGSLDPRGYPLMYVGAGDNASGKAPRMFVISLIEGKILYEQSGADTDAKRSWYAFDSAPLVDAETDTLIWPGESGVLYTIKLNTQYNKTAGTISVAPETTVKARYTSNLNRKIGCESSTLIVGRYLYYADNGGLFFCVDLDTMALVWAQDTKDDVNATPVFQWGEDGKGYIYTATSMEYSNSECYIQKLDAATGEILWEKTYSNVAFNESVSGGVLSSPVLGKTGTDLEGLIIYSVSRTPTANGGTLVALDTDTGEVVWEKKLTYYAWSSPVALYNADGKSYLVLCDSNGNATLFDGKTGETLASISLGSNVEASPAAFENTLVVGTRGQQVFALTVE